MTNAGLPRSDATWCIAILGIANTISKWTCGFLCNKKYLKTYSMYAWSHILSGLVSCMIVFANSSMKLYTVPMKLFHSRNMWAHLIMFRSTEKGNRSQVLERVACIVNRVVVWINFMEYFSGWNDTSISMFCIFMHTRTDNRTIFTDT